MVSKWARQALVVLSVAGVVIVMWWLIVGARPTAVPTAFPTAVPMVETTLHAAGEGITCWVMRRGNEILGSGCLR